MALNMLDFLYARQDLWRVADRMREWHESLFRHSVEVANRAAAVALAMGRPEAEVELVMLAGFLHDYGKVTWPKDLACKHVLDEDDWSIIKIHLCRGHGWPRSRCPGSPGSSCGSSRSTTRRTATGIRGSSGHMRFTR